MRVGRAHLDDRTELRVSLRPAGLEQRARKGEVPPGTRNPVGRGPRPSRRRRSSAATALAASAPNMIEKLWSHARTE